MLDAEHRVSRDRQLEHIERALTGSMWRSQVDDLSDLDVWIFLHGDAMRPLREQPSALLLERRSIPAAAPQPVLGAPSWRRRYPTDCATHS